MRRPFGVEPSGPLLEGHGLGNRQIAVQALGGLAGRGAGDRRAVRSGEGTARSGEQLDAIADVIFAVDAVAGAGRELQIVGGLVIKLAEGRIGVQLIEGAVVIIVGAAIGRVGAAKIRRIEGVAGRGIGGEVDGFDRNGQAVRIDVVVAGGVIVQEVAAEAEVPGTGEGRLDAGFIRELTRVLGLNVQRGERVVGSGLRIRHRPARDRRADNAGHVRQAEGGVIGPRGGAARIIVFAREVGDLIIGHFVGQQQVAGDVVLGVPGEQVFLGVILRNDGREDVAIVGGRGVVGVLVAGRQADGHAIEAGQSGGGVGQAVIVRAVDRAVLAALAQIILGDGVGGHAADGARTRIMDAELLADARAGVVFVEVFPHHIGAQAVGRLPLGRDAA